MRGRGFARGGPASLGLLLLCLVGCPQPKPPPVAEVSPLPVTIKTLAEEEPLQRLRLTGSVSAWKSVQLGFVVGGRVDWTLDEGDEVLGRTDDEEGRRIAEGTVVARLDTRRFELAVRVKQADVVATRAQAEGLRTQVQEVLTEERRATESDLERADKDLVRYTDLVARGVAQQAQLDRTQAEQRALTARVASIDAKIKAKQAELDSALAQLQQQEEAVRQAGLDLDDASLRCPFDGRVAEMHVTPGAFVSPGQPVASVVMMDPIQVELVVSADTDQSIGYGDTVLVQPARHAEPLVGLVLQKDTVADPATRTFTIKVMVRNQRVPDVMGEAAPPELPRIELLSRVELHRGSGSSYVDVRALRGEGAETHVWRVRERLVHPGRRTARVHLDRVAVTPQEARLALLGRVFRAVDDALQPEDVVLCGELPPGHTDGGEVVFARTRWLLRPGELVEVSLSHPDRQAGLYVPVEAIVREAGAEFVFRVEGESGREVARKAPVRILGSAGELKRVAGVGLEPGTRVVIRGAHQVVTGDRVSIVEWVDDAP